MGNAHDKIAVLSYAVVETSIRPPRKVKIPRPHIPQPLPRRLNLTLQAGATPLVFGSIAVAVAPTPRRLDGNNPVGVYDAVRVAKLEGRTRRGCRESVDGRNDPDDRAERRVGSVLFRVDLTNHVFEDLLVAVAGRCVDDGVEIRVLRESLLPLSIATVDLVVGVDGRLGVNVEGGTGDLSLVRVASSLTLLEL
jgi:hypothetical protein